MTWLVEGTSIDDCMLYTAHEYLENKLPTVKEDLYVVADRGMYETMLFLGYNCKRLTEYKFGNFYEMYSVWFGDMVESPEEMLKLLYWGLFSDDVQQVNILKAGVFFTWFTLSDTDTLHIGGSLQFSKTVNICTVGQFIKSLSKAIVKSGYSVRALRWYVWTESDMPTEFRRYISNFMLLNWNESTGKEWVRQLQSYRDLYTVLNREYTKANISAEMFIKVLWSTRSTTGFRIDKLTGKVYWDKMAQGSLNYILIQDNDISVSTKSIGTGIIVDCEGDGGTFTQGFRECGGIIFTEYTDCIVSYKTFNTDRVLALDSFKRAVELEHECSKQRRHTLYIYTYGTGDEAMIRNTLSETGGNLKQILGLEPVFVDVLPLVTDYLVVNGYKQQYLPSKLTDVARLLGVTAEKAHQALSDAVTLFNILAKMKRDNYFKGTPMYAKDV